MLHVMKRSPQAATNEALRGLGAVAPGLVDKGMLPLYDRVIVPVATATGNPILFFTVPLGSGTGISGAKQLWDTNMTQAGRLEDPQHFEVRAVRFYVEPDIASSDLTKLYSNYVLNLIVGDKTYQLAPLWYFPAGGGLYASGNLSTARLASTLPEQFYGNGMPDPRAICAIDDTVSVKINQGENFRVELQGTTFTTQAAGGTVFGTGLDMRIVLDGILTRAVR